MSSVAVAENTASVGVVVMTPDQMETATLAELEAVVRRGLDAFIEVGQALRAIRDRKLYRKTHATFEAYCAERFDMTRPRAYEAMAVADVVNQMSGMPDISLPANPRQAVALAPVKNDPEKLHAAAKKVQAEKGDAATAADYSTAAAEQLGRSVPKPNRSVSSGAESLVVNQDIPPDLEGSALGFGDAPPDASIPGADDLGVEGGQPAWARSTGALCNYCRQPVPDDHVCSEMPKASRAFPYTHPQPCTDCGGAVAVESVQAERAIESPQAERHADGSRVTLLCETCQLEGETPTPVNFGQAAPLTDPVLGSDAWVHAQRATAAPLTDRGGESEAGSSAPCAPASGDAAVNASPPTTVTPDRPGDAAPPPDAESPTPTSVAAPPATHHASQEEDPPLEDEPSHRTNGKSAGSKGGHSTASVFSGNRSLDAGDLSRTLLDLPGWLEALTENATAEQKRTIREAFGGTAAATPGPTTAAVPTIAEVKAQINALPSGVGSVASHAFGLLDLDAQKKHVAMCQTVIARVENPSALAATWGR